MMGETVFCSGQPARSRDTHLRQMAVIGSVVASFGAISAQLLALGLSAQPQMSLAAAETVVASTYSRPDIVDRNGRLLATDLEVPSIFADPSLVIDRDEAVETLATVLTDLDQTALRRDLADRSRRFVWVRRHVSPKLAQRVHDLGLPGISFRTELKRAYPAGQLAAELLGSVDVDNKGTSGVERWVDSAVGTDAVHTARLSSRTPVRLSLDLGVQYALEDELKSAVRLYEPEGAAGLVLDVRSGELVASATVLREAKAGAKAGDQTGDRVAGGSYELGSVAKILTVAMAFDEGIAKPSTILDVRTPLIAGPYTISDMHASDRPLSVTEVFTHSSNVGAGMLALEAGDARYRAFLGKLGLTAPMVFEAGPISPPLLPKTWDKASLITASYGHGIAIAPLQFASAVAAVLNGGHIIKPTLIKRLDEIDEQQGKTVVTAQTTRQMATLFRQNVAGTDGTGERADVPGFAVGGKTGTADRAINGGYDRKSVIASFLGAFPMNDPRFLTFVLLFDPKGVAETNGARTASTNAAPVTARLVARIASQLGVAPQKVTATQ